MDVETDFPTSPAKRQRTNSPEEARDAPQSIESHPTSTSASASVPDGQPENPPLPTVESATVEATPESTAADTAIQNGQTTVPDHDSNSLLDALMLQVEAASAPPPQEPPASTGPTVGKVESTEKVAATEPPTREGEDGVHNAERQPAEDVQQQAQTEVQTTDHVGRMDLAGGAVNGDTVVRDVEHKEPPAVTVDTDATAPTVGNENDTRTVAQDIVMDGIAATEGLAPEPGAEGAEWEIDSSPYESSSDSDSSSDTTSSEEDSDEDDADGDYAMLDPEETARILMQADIGSDDEGGRTRDKTDGGLRTAHERPEEVIPKPDITVTEDMKIEELGNVEAVVENTVVIKAKTSGEYQVLETGSLICLQDRTVVGVVADLIGRVEEPRYTIRFNNDDEIKEVGLSKAGAAVFYVPQHSTFVFTQPLKGVKGSDASNFHDEEVGEDEMEFSDDEAEAEYKRQMKARRQGRALETGRGHGGSKHARGSHRGGARGGSHSHTDSAAYGNGSLEMNYDDVGAADGGDEGYTPLQRPANLAELLTRGEQPQDSGLPASLPPLPPQPRSGRGDFSGRWRGRGRGGGGRGGSRGHHHGGGGFNQSRAAAYNNNQGSHPGNSRNGFSQQMSLPNLNLPTTPAITPQNVPYSPMTPSPITPLPNGQFNFNGFNPPANFPFMPPSLPGFPQAFGVNFQQQQQQYQQRWAGQPQPQPQQQQQQQNHGYQQNMAAPPNFSAGPWASNPALAAALQKQAEEERRRQGA